MTSLPLDDDGRLSLAALSPELRAALEEAEVVRLKGLDGLDPEVRRLVELGEQLAGDVALHGFAVVDADGERLDPSSVSLEDLRPVGSNLYRKP